ncbi:hypothetical protein [Parenemella sanctibonifatiensis]|uniref:Terminase n=1 Tax=Parenemella sanctibonifatiensis TaxID=2016505 RepID=A0A255ECJ1_9ACTN|nr:hypothetical protein [Parenemella sanctibonifatiensis]OYN89278.1 hypothetical protein CGZ92_02880 [Parenemella sanctibonifatiensis]
MAMTTEPTFSRVPEGDETTGRDCVELAARYGVALDDWQTKVIAELLREREGSWAASQCGLVVGRQNGKGQILLAVELYGLLVLRETILHTAHAVKTSSDAFRRLWDVLQSHKDLSSLVERHSQQIGAEYVQLRDGGRIAFTTRSASAGRGLSVDRLVIDEAEDLPANEVGALAPTVFSRPQAQSMYFGTAPTSSHDSEAFQTLRNSAHNGLNPRSAWWEWCAEWGADPDDRDLWERVNPAVSSGRVPIRAVEDDRSILPLDQFRAERLSMWPPAQSSADAIITAQQWDELRDPYTVPDRGIIVGVDASPSRERATVCIAGRRKDGFVHLEWYATDEGVTWLPNWVAARLHPKVWAVVIDERSSVASLDWAAAGVRVTTARTRDIADASGLFVDAVNDRLIRHPGQIELSRGVLEARIRPLAGGFSWDRKAPGSSALIAATLAAWGVGVEPRRLVPPDANRKSTRTAILLSSAGDPRLA